MEIYLIRHTTPEVGTNICYGQSDIGLAGSFASESQAIQDELNGFTPDVVFSSPLKRCHLLAQTLFHTQTASLSDDLMEMDFGQWEMLPWNDIPMAELQPWMDDFYFSAPPGGESFDALNRRVARFLTSLKKLPAESKIAVVTHSGCLRAFLMQWLTIPHTHIFNLRLEYGAVLKTTVAGEVTNVQFLYLNET